MALSINKTLQIPKSKWNVTVRDLI
jgi:hypothetical protein